MNIIFSTDEKYVRHVGVSVISLLENNKESVELNIDIIEFGVSEQSKEKLLEIANKYNRKINFIESNTILPAANFSSAFPVSSFARLFLMRLAYDKAIYMDCDSVVNGSLEEIWNTDMSDFYVGGVLDIVDKKYLLDIGLDTSCYYINAGFLLLNLKKLREDKLEEKFISFINKYNGDVPHFDQGVVNAVCDGKKMILHPKYNVHSTMGCFTCDQVKMLTSCEKYYKQSLIDEALLNPVFIHYTNGYVNRPWNVGSTHPYKDIYLKYLNMSFWKGDLLEQDLNRNSKIMKFIYDNMPFRVYWLVWKMMSKIKR